MSLKLFQSLLFKSARIQEAIRQEMLRRWPDHFRLLKLKKLRLAVKDRMHRLLERHAPAGRGAAMALRPVRIKPR